MVLAREEREEVEEEREEVEEEISPCWPIVSLWRAIVSVWRPIVPPCLAGLVRDLTTRCFALTCLLYSAFFKRLSC